MRLQVHTVEQQDSDITAFILGCNRLELLAQTVASFLETRDLPTKIVIVDDSAEPGVFEHLVEKYGHFADIVCFPENRGLWWAKDFMVSFCSTPYIFYVEEDWLFLKSGYLGASKKILEQYRDIGSIDLSWRTFEVEGIDAYDPELVDNLFFRKKPWQITENHLHWFCWVGSPNLKRRDDLLLLGRVEKYFNEWNVDRKFAGLGFKGVFLADRYVVHLGDHCSVMAKKRPHEHTTPESLFPAELKPNRSIPEFDYYGMDQVAYNIRGNVPRHRSNKRTFVTCLLDLDREAYDKRNFVDHYVRGVEKLVEMNVPLVIFVDSRYYFELMRITGGRPIEVIAIDPWIIQNRPYFPRLREICSSPEWQNQAEWMKTSIIRSPEYIGLTFHKMELMQHCVNHNLFRSETYYWLDSGICNSFNLRNLTEYNFDKLPNEKFFLTKFRYDVVTEMHGYAREGFQQLCGQIPEFVARATLFGGTKNAISAVYDQFNQLLERSLAAGYIGTEEAIFSGLLLTHPELFETRQMANGSISNYLESIRGST